jgi:hypothetical protein
MSTCGSDFELPTYQRARSGLITDSGPLPLLPALIDFSSI